MGSKAETAFVIHIESTESCDGLAGRLEHVISGRCARFRDLSELQHEIEAILRTRKVPLPTHPGIHESSK